MGGILFQLWIYLYLRLKRLDTWWVWTCWMTCTRDKYLLKVCGVHQLILNKRYLTASVMMSLSFGVQLAQSIQMIVMRFSFILFPKATLLSLPFLCNSSTLRILKTNSILVLRSSSNQVCHLITSISTKNSLAQSNHLKTHLST